jgi:transposase
MRRIRQVLRLASEAGLKQRQIARSLTMSPATVGEYLRRARLAGLSWPLPGELDDTQLEARLFPPPPKRARAARPLADWAEVHCELKRKGVTLTLLWEEYKATHPEGLQYSQFCERYRRFAKTLNLVMRQHHRAGEKLFVDYAGQTVPIVERATGEVREAQVFVAALGASNFTYAEATWTQTLPDWCASHIRTFEYMGSVAELLIPDNLKSAVIRPCRYEPGLNATYQALAEHYGTAILPARVRKPRDKAKVENGVLLAERWILARLRHHTFFSLSELNQAIAVLLEALNNKPCKKLPGSRRTLFETLERPAMKPLPAERYVYAEWSKARVNIDYHVELDGHYYSVPYQLVGQQLDVCLSAHTVELLHRARRVASHRRSHAKGHHTTVPEHMPKPHREYASWTPERLVRWATKSGAATAELVATIMASRVHPQQGFRSCLGLMRLGKSFGAERLEAACRRALNIRAHSYKSVHSILKNRLDEKPLPPPEEPTREPIVHDNIRGAKYYHAEHRTEEESPGASADEESTSEPCTEHTTPEPTYH